MSFCFVILAFFFFKQKTAYEMRISDWSSDVCSSDLIDPFRASAPGRHRRPGDRAARAARPHGRFPLGAGGNGDAAGGEYRRTGAGARGGPRAGGEPGPRAGAGAAAGDRPGRSEEHTSELQSLMRISYAVFYLK